MKNLIGLFDAIVDTYDRQEFLPSENVSHCNQAVEAVCNAMGCSDLDNKTADEILTYLLASTNWASVTMLRAQELANQGSLVVAGLNSEALKQAHGHVVIIRPGLLCESGKWGPSARCLNMGAEVFLGRAKRGPLTGMPAGVNEAFLPMPLFYVWNASL